MSTIRRKISVPSRDIARRQGGTRRRSRRRCSPPLSICAVRAAVLKSARELRCARARRTMITSLRSGDRRGPRRGPSKLPNSGMSGIDGLIVNMPDVYEAESIALAGKVVSTRSDLGRRWATKPFASCPDDHPEPISRRKARRAVVQSPDDARSSLQSARSVRKRRRRAGRLTVRRSRSGTGRRARRRSQLRGRLDVPGPVPDQVSNALRSRWRDRRRGRGRRREVGEDSLWATGSWRSPASARSASRSRFSSASLVKMPDALSFAQGATMIQSYATALYAFDARGSKTGRRFSRSVPGEGSGLPPWTWRPHYGAHVIAAASSTAKLAAAVAVGAEGTIAYEEEDLKVRAREISGGGVDVVIDPVGGDEVRSSAPGARQIRQALRHRVHSGDRLRAAQPGVAQQQERHRHRLGSMGGERSGRQPRTHRRVGDHGERGQGCIRRCRRNTRWRTPRG